MGTRALKHHPNYWLEDSAADHFDSAEDAHGVLDVTSAGRTLAEQQALINRWNAGGAANRPPNLYEPAMPATSSNHVGGHAIDIGNPNTFAAYSQNYGFRHTYPGSDPVHFDYVAGSSGGTVPTSVTDTKNRQAWLNAHQGAHLAVDGVQGPATTAAIKAYQQFLTQHWNYKGAIDGIWGPATQAAHQAYANSLVVAPPAPSGGAVLKQGSTGPAVSALQAFLNKNYPLYSKLTVDGNFGPATKAVVEQFQKRSGLAVDGIVGPATHAKLGI